MGHDPNKSPAFPICNRGAIIIGIAGGGRVQAKRVELGSGRKCGGGGRLFVIRHGLGGIHGSFAFPELLVVALYRFFRNPRTETRG